VLVDQIQYHYIDADGQKHGPVGFDELVSAASSGHITPATLVWQPEWTDWRPGSSVPGLFNDVIPPTVAPPRFVPTQRSPWGIPAMPPKFYPPGSFMTLYWCWLPLNIIAQVVLIVGSVYMFAAGVTGDDAEINEAVFIGLGVVCGGFLLQIPAVVLLCYLIYRAWRQIQDGQAETSAGKAVGFYFIPFFNIYWQFVMYWGLAKDLGAYAERYGVQGVRISSGYALGVIITVTVASVLAGCLGVFGMPIAAIAGVLMMVLTYQIAVCSSAIAEAGERGIGHVDTDASDPLRATLDA